MGPGRFRMRVGSTLGHRAADLDWDLILDLPSPARCQPCRHTASGVPVCTQSHQWAQVVWAQHKLDRRAQMAFIPRARARPNIMNIFQPRPPAFLAADHYGVCLFWASPLPRLGGPHSFGPMQNGAQAMRTTVSSIWKRRALPLDTALSCVKCAEGSLRLQCCSAAMRAACRPQSKMSPRKHRQGQSIGAGG